MSRGDINAFFGLMLDSLSDLILMASLLVTVFGMPSDFVLSRMIPGTAIGVMTGDLIYTIMAIRLGRRTGRLDVTAMPLGLDTPSTFGTVFLIIGPCFSAAIRRNVDPHVAAQHAWFMGITMILASGVFKIACAPFSGLIRRVVPRAGLLGSLTSIALVIISFLPLLDIASQPIAGFMALGIILATLSACWELPRKFPGALAALLAGGAVYYTMHVLGFGAGLGAEGALPRGAIRFAIPFPMGEWFFWFRVHGRETLAYLPIAIPLAIATVIGGIDCVESASAAGDDYPTGPIIAAEGIATVVGGLFGGVIQSTPYIGHPAYKAMGARAGYTLATAIFVGGAGVFGYFDWIFYVIPKPVVFPILIFIGLEMTAQSFRATPRRHYPALSLACVPALAYLALFASNQILSDSGQPFAKLSSPIQHRVQTILILANGFIITSLLWGSMLSHLIDGQIRSAAGSMILAASLALFGFIHSPLPSAPVLLPSRAIAQLKREGRFEASAGQTPYHWSLAYGGVALALAIIGIVGKSPTPQTEEDHSNQ
ncbi:MAG: permease [Isosphaeraceae bacterium]